MLIGDIYPSMGQNGNIYTTDGLSPAIISGVGVRGRGIGSNNAPKILVLDDYNGMIHRGASRERHYNLGAYGFEERMENNGGL